MPGDADDDADNLESGSKEETFSLEIDIEGEEIVPGVPVKQLAALVKTHPEIGRLLRQGIADMDGVPGEG